MRHAYYFLVIYCNTKLPSQGARLCKWLHSELFVTNHKKLAETLNSRHIPDSIDEEGKRKQTPTWIKMCFKTTLTKIYHEFTVVKALLKLYLLSSSHLHLYYICFIISNYSNEDPSTGNLWLPWS